MSSNSYSNPKINTMSIIAVIAAFTVSPVGVVLAYIARKQIRASGERGYILTRFALYVGTLFTVTYPIGIIFGWQAASMVSM